MSALTGTRRLGRLAVRRERFIAPCWILLLGAMTVIMASYVERWMSTPELLARYTTMINENSFFRAVGGDAVIADLGYMAAWRSGGALYVFCALAALTAVIRYTRADEDTGRTELLRAGVVSRYAALTTGLLVAGCVSLACGVLPAGLMIAMGFDPTGSLTYGAGVTVSGLVFGAIAALAAQVAQNARTARMISFSALGISYLLRFAGDASGQYWLKYASPLGWTHLVAPYRDNRLWILLISLAVAAVLTAVAYRVAGVRDLGAGLVPERAGRATAPELRGPIRLSWRLNRGLFLKWAAGTGVFAVGAGGVTTMADQLENTPDSFATKLVEGFGGSPTATYFDNGLWAITLIVAYVVTLYPVLMVQRLRAEETSGRTEALQATPISRLRWAGGHLVVTGLGTAALLALFGVLFGATFALIHGAPSNILRTTAGAVGTVPAALLVGAVCMLAYGLLPRAAVALSWLAWIATIVLGRIAGPLYDLWGGTPVEPFHYIPNTVAGDEFTPLPALVMVVATAALAGAGLLALRRRDFA
ncbi:ABC transporter permease [Amycolatopsis suaedae]|uniref:Polyketide antibiotic transporter n=1 Tax=Amycolatopsis suaedae TaxID=2510978 RepID=A0A4Q7J9Y4_9PSEU|nr:polyketide antibiotic transporter [Amycolatopsis suaedae]RZQ64581.1 polyketide antibiotic transporter [Amycolatopsis suaedae]